ncbi:MAG: RNA-binding protein [Eubacteriales bacterium]
MNDNREFFARIADLCERSRSRYCPCYTGFLSPEEQVCAKRASADFPDVFCLTFGGVPDAERALLGFYPEEIYLRPSEPQATDKVYQEYEKDAGLAFVKIAGSGFRRFNHRDVLGALMSLGIKRETLGDILLDEENKNAYVVTLATVAPFVCDTLTGVANDRVRVQSIPGTEMPVRQQRFADLSLTLASLRLDALIAAMLGVSRENAKRLVNAGRVSVNHAVCTAVDRVFAEGDTVSVKGGGKFLVDALLGQTVKNRYRVIVRKYL